MPCVLEVDNLRQGYLDVIEHVRSHGEPAAPRGQGTREVLDAIIVLHDPRDALPVGVGRQLNVGIGVLEATQLIAGQHAPMELFRRVAPNMLQFAEDADETAPHGWFHGNYGARASRQLVVDVVRRLQDDPDSRQAVVTFWNPALDWDTRKRDLPCTVMLQFLIRRDKLVMHTTMRSNDVWWGLCYDAFMFTQAQLTVAGALGIDVGPYHHHAVSLHAYERDFTAMDHLHEPEARGFMFNGIGSAGHTMTDRMMRARALTQGDPLSEPTATELAYAHALA